MLTHEQFVEDLRNALNQLYDPDRLCKSPLATLFGVAGRVDTYSALQRILTEAIASLEPQPDTPSQLRAWRIYELLFYRYVQQHTVQMVADQLGVTVRHLRREQRAALEALAYRLWQQFDLDSSPHSAASEPAPTQDGPSVRDELAWLGEGPPKEPTSLSQALAIVTELAGPLATQHAVHLQVTADESLPAVAMHQVALNQILLNLLSVAIPWAAGGRVSVSARSVVWEAEVELRGPRASSRPPGEDELASLDIARQIAELCGGNLTLAGDEKTFCARLAVPILEQVVVLAIDDNEDTLHLLERYTAATRYRLVGTQDPEQAVALAQKVSPQIIVVDVMMPSVDGWRVLAQLRQHPQTAHIPVLVCTILAQENLALSLGASGFVRKPVSQQDFLAALDRQVKRTVRGSR